LRFPVIAAVLLGVVLASASVGTAQLGIFPSPTPRPDDPKPTPVEPELTPPSSESTPTPEPDPVPSDVLPDVPTPTPKKSEKPKKSDDALDAVEDELPDSLLEEFEVPSFPRTRPRNTVALVKALEPLTELGIPREQVLVEGMGRFPVAGLAHYFDDWLNPRFTPKPHLHKGLDIFADFGTPIRSPDKGVVTALPNHGAGGTAVWVRSQDGISYYFAHMLERVDGIHIGQRVEMGTVLGYVGDTGNAQGGTPHLHFEIHPGGGAAIPPKPTVDAWLDEALEIAPKWVAARERDLRAKRETLGSTNGTGGATNKELEASMLLTLLDPVGGSVGMLPSLNVRPRGSSAVSDRLLADLISKRIEGRIFIPSNKLHLHD
jgi:murein DD-endopeptidase MepM/ murein hydrolase activator NlpD